jgi:amino acid adenylation domain-containing protein
MTQATSDPGTIHRVFEEQARRSPGRVALRHAARVLTYREVNQRANALAWQLVRNGVGRKQFVALAMDRSPELIIAMLAVLKCGAAYLPLDGANPVARSIAALDQAGVRIVIADRPRPELCTNGRRSVLFSASNASEAENEPPLVRSEPGDACYLMYTSGSTGASKGVVVPHRAVLRLVIDTNYIQITPRDRVLVFGPPSFDASTFEIWGPLLNGGAGILYPGDRFDPALFASTLEAEGVSVAWLTAGLFHLLAERRPDVFRPLRTLLAGGDILYPALVNSVLDAVPNLTVINGYGPTENTTFTCCHRMTVVNRPRGQVPIGVPITGTRIHVLASDGSHSARGEVGELFVSGLGVALGYVGEEGDGSAFLYDGALDEGLIYRTGDFVRQNEFGQLEFVGRKDNLVKLRGYRVNLEEVQSALCRVAGVLGAVVLLQRVGSGDQRLVAHVQTKTTLSSEQLRLELDETLPRYMIPDELHLNQPLPLNENGKVDRRSLVAGSTSNAREA